MVAPLRFGTVYFIRSQAFDADERAENLAAEKRKQGVDAEASGPALFYPEEVGMHAFVYTNEGDNALDSFRKKEQSEIAAYETLEREIPEFYQEDQSHLSSEEVRQMLTRYHQRFQELFLSPDSDVRKHKDALKTCFENPEKLYFDESGNKVDYVPGIWSK